MLGIAHPSNESLDICLRNLRKEGFGPIWVLEIGLT
jgi:hypothetical protein